ncbi:Cytochrome c-551 precursor [compost metagenome]
MNIRLLLPLAITGGMLASQAAIAEEAGEVLFKAKGCAACHAIDMKMVGPAYKDVAAKFAGQAGADEELAKKIKEGSQGVWGPIPMPPNSVTAEEATTLAKWVLSQK